MQARLPASLGTLGTFEGSVARFLARKLRRISKELTATNQKVGLVLDMLKPIFDWNSETL